MIDRQRTLEQAEAAEDRERALRQATPHRRLWPSSHHLPWPSPPSTAHRRLQLVLQLLAQAALHQPAEIVHQGAGCKVDEAHPIALAGHERCPLQLAELSRVAGDSCAGTTWENATLTATWLGEHHPGAPVLMITDPWQLPRAARAFAGQGLQVMPLAAEPPLSPAERNRLALRETAATLLYRLQGRM